MATHSSVLAWRIPGTGEPGGLPSLGSHKVGHDWSDLAAAAAAPAPGTLLLCPLIPIYCLHLLTQLSLSNLQIFLKRLLSKGVPGPQGHPFPWLYIQGYQKFLPIALFTVSIIYSLLWRDQFHKSRNHECFGSILLKIIARKSINIRQMNEWQKKNNLNIQWWKYLNRWWHYTTQVSRQPLKIM